MAKRNTIDYDELKRLHGLKLSDRDIAEKLGCTRVGVTYARGCLGLGPIGAYTAPWSAEQRKLLHRLWSEGLRDKAIAGYFSVTHNAIHRQRKIMKLATHPRLRTNSVRTIKEPSGPSPDERFACAMQGGWFADFAAGREGYLRSLPPPTHIETQSSAAMAAA